MDARPIALTASLVLVAACGGKAIWDPDYHSNVHPEATSSGSGGSGSSVATVGAGGATGTGGGGEGGAVTAVVSASASSSASSSASASVSSSAGAGGAMTSTSFEEVPLGTKNAGEPFTVTVPEGTLGFTVVVKSGTKYGRMGVQTISSPTQEAVVSNYSVPATGWEFSWYGLTPAGVPQSSAASAMPKVAPGTWSVTIGDPYENSKTGTVSVWLRTSSDGLFHGGTIDVNIFRVPSVSSDAYIDAVVAKAFAGWAGIQLGALAHYPLPEQYATINGANALSVVEESKVASNIPALNLYVIGQFVDDLQNVLGIAAGIPGVGIAPGSLSSGVLMMPGTDPAVDAEVIKHESGHLSGLFHTTEIDGAFVDPLTDTPTCGNVQQELFNCPDATNIMFPVAIPSAEKFSAMQQKVVQGATLYRGAFDSLAMSQAVTPPSSVVTSSPTFSVATGAWRAHVDATTANLLGAHWCHDTQRPDFLAMVRRRATPSQLRAVAADPSAPGWLRGRAARAAVWHR